MARFEEGGQGVGFAVLGGAFGEGIDLPGSRLIGAFVASLGLPQYNELNEITRERMGTELLQKNGLKTARHALLASLALIEGEEGAQRRAQLKERIAQLRLGLEAVLPADGGARLPQSPTAIQPLIVGDNARAMLTMT